MRPAQTVLSQVSRRFVFPAALLTAAGEVLARVSAQPLPLAGHSAPRTQRNVPLAVGQPMSGKAATAGAGPGTFLPGAAPGVGADPRGAAMGDAEGDGPILLNDLTALVPPHGALRRATA